MEILTSLREIIQFTRLDEELKWSIPCYTYQGKNVLTLSALNDKVSIGFFKGVLLNDPDKILTPSGPNSRSAMQINFTSIEQVTEHTHRIKQLIEEAIKVEEEGKAVKFSNESLDIPKELQNLLSKDTGLKESWKNLTPGRKRSHIIHINSAKQEKTRINRASKCSFKIIQGKGFNEY